MSVEVFAYFAAAAASTLPLFLRAKQRRLWGLVAAIVLVAAGFGALRWQPPQSLPPAQNRPLQIKETGGSSERGFVTSNQCRSCHPAQYASWHASYHRTMTQVVTSESVVADFDNLQLWFDGRRYDLSRRDGEFWVELSDPDGVDRVIQLAQRGEVDQARALAASLPRTRRRIVMSTGSHHHQLYWYSSGSGSELYMLPFVYLIKDQRWVPRVSAFLVPPNEVEPRKVWNRDCLPCHSTDGSAGYSADEPLGPRLGVPDSRLAEAGIGCEACHGPAEEHVRGNSNPVRRYRLRLAGEGDPGMVQPERLPAAKSAEICGQCHSVNTEYTYQDWTAMLRQGSNYQAGADLAGSRYIVSRETVSDSPLFEGWLGSNPRFLDEWFWPDGQIRVTGREYNGLLESPCYRGGKFSCISCHSMHESDPNDQLAARMEGDEACLQCHQKFRRKLDQHTHHPAASSGSRCYNCHMPNTTYGLLQLTRSHTVNSPSLSDDLESGRPNACNLCHLDQTLGWTAGHLERWYGVNPAEVSEEQRSISAAVVALLKGDAGVRALVAWHMGWGEAQEASGKDWLAPFLAQTLNDPYDAVRYIGARSLRRLPGFREFSYDFLAPPGELARAPQRAAEQWKLPPESKWKSRGSRVLIGHDGLPRRDEIDRLLRQRDDRPVYLVE